MQARSGHSNYSVSFLVVAVMISATSVFPFDFLGV